MVKAEVRIIDTDRPNLNKTYICYPTMTHIMNSGETTYEFHFEYSTFDFKFEDDLKEVNKDDE